MSQMEKISPRFNKRGQICGLIVIFGWKISWRIFKDVVEIQEIIGEIFIIISRNVHFQDRRT